MLKMNFIEYLFSFVLSFYPERYKAISEINLKGLNISFLRKSGSFPGKVSWKRPLICWNMKNM
jgi:hypothetical protein